MADYIKYGGILCIITVIVALLLGGVNTVTAPIAEANNMKIKQESITAVLGEVYGEGTLLTVTGETTVQEITEYDSPSGYVYAVTAKPTGYGGEMELTIGIDSMLNVLGVSFVSMSETPGLGARADSEEFLGQFKGYYPDFVPISGATITSNAVKTGVYDALKEVGAYVE